MRGSCSPQRALEIAAPLSQLRRVGPCPARSATPQAVDGGAVRLSAVGPTERGVLAIQELIGRQACVQRSQASRNPARGDAQRLRSSHRWGGFFERGSIGRIIPDAGNLRGPRPATRANHDSVRPPYRLTDVFLELATELSIKSLGEWVVAKKSDRAIGPCQRPRACELARAS